MPKAKDHYLPLFVGDFLASTLLWTGPERGLYLQLLAIQWATGPLPPDLDRLAAVAGYVTAEFALLWKTVGPKFRTDARGMLNHRLEQVRLWNTQIQNARSASGRKGAAARWDGRIDGKRNSKTDGKRIGEGNGSGIADALANKCHPIRSDPNEDKRAAPRATRSAATYMPEDFKLTEERLAYAIAQKLSNPARTFQNFYDYWFNRNDKKAKKRDWDRAWQVWCRKDADDQKVGQSAPKTKFELYQEHIDGED